MTQSLTWMAGIERCLLLCLQCDCSAYAILPCTASSFLFSHTPNLSPAAILIHTTLSRPQSVDGGSRPLHPSLRFGPTDPRRYCAKGRGVRKGLVSAP
ncbi:hypothetical protein HDV57DRAFT_505620 [Trichoderma longibrachiatum]